MLAYAAQLLTTVLPMQLRDPVPVMFSAEMMVRDTAT